MKFLAAVHGVVRTTGGPTMQVIESGLPAAPAIDESTRFRVGSLSKVFTAIGVLRLVTPSGRTLCTDYGEMGELVPVAPYEFVAARYLPGERLRFSKNAGEGTASAVYVSLTLHTRLEGELLAQHEKLKVARFGRPAPEPEASP